MKAFWFMPPYGVPTGWKLVTDEAVKNPYTDDTGALIRNDRTGIYCLWSAGATQSFPQDLAQKIDAEANK